MTEVGLRVNNANKSFGRHHVVKDLSLEVRRGEVFGFLGPNGAGKTTLIKMVMGFLFPDSGEIFISNFSVRRDYEKAMAHIGGIVENPEMYKEFSGWQNLNMYARVHGHISSERIKKVVEMVGLSDRINDKVGKYSLGMKQRLGLAQSIVHKPDVLILDEPMNGLDPSGIQDLRNILRELAHEENLAVMVSSHILTEMQLLCDRVAIINKGEIIGSHDLQNSLVGKSIYRLEVEPKNEAAAFLAARYKDVKISDNGILLNVERNKIPELLYELHNQGLRPYRVEPCRDDLEATYFAAIGGGNDIV